VGCHPEPLNLLVTYGNAAHLSAVTPPTRSVWPSADTLPVAGLGGMTRPAQFNWAGLSRCEPVA